MWRSRRLQCAGVAGALLVLGGCSVSGTGLSAPESRLEPEGASVLRLNAFTMSSQDHVALARLADGSHAVVWDSRKQQHGYSGVYGRVVGADGGVRTPETRLNIETTNAQMRPAVAGAPDGSVWVAWQSFLQDGEGWGVVARRLGADLSAGSPEIGVNQTRSGTQQEPVVAVDESGTVLIGWSSRERVDAPATAFARLFAPDGKSLTDEFRVSGAPTGTEETTLSAAALVGGGFALAWTSVDGSGRGTIAARLYEGDATPRSGVLTLASGEFDRIEPGIGADERGGFAVAWHVASPGGWGVEARAFDGEGRPVGDPVLVAPGDPEHPRQAGAIAHIAGDRWLVAHNRLGSAANDPAVVLGVEVDLRLGGVGAARSLAGVSEENQRLAPASGASRLFAWSDGGYGIGWSGEGGLGDGSGAHLTISRPGLRAMAWAPETEETAVSEAIAMPHIPPIRDPNFVPREPLVEFGSDNGDFGFNALGFSGLTPPDPDLAVGPGGIVATGNAAIAFFEKDGTKTFSQNIDNFFAEAGAFGFIFDPEALFDEHAQRFWVMANERASNQSYFLVAVSDDDNPEGTWFKYRLLVSNVPGIGGDIDSPNFAVDDEFVYLTADFFTPSTRFLIFNVPKAPLLDGGAAPPGTSIVNVGTQSFGVPQHNDLSAPRQYMIESTEFSVNDVVRLHAINNPGGSPSLTTFTLDVPDYRFPGAPPQKGSSVSPFLFEPRFWSTEYVNGSLWAVHHIRPVGVSWTVVRWYEIAMNGWPGSGQSPELAQWGEIDAGAGIHSYFPSISANAEGDAAVTFSRSSTQEFISMWRALRRAGDPAGTFGPMELVKESLGPDNSGRWGDYSQTRFEPSKPCVFWGHNEWQPGGSWNTWIAEFFNGSPADLNRDCALDVLDFLAFQGLFAAQDPEADINNDGAFDILDFVEFQALFQQG